MSNQYLEEEFGLTPPKPNGEEKMKHVGSRIVLLDRFYCADSNDLYCPVCKSSELRLVSEVSSAGTSVRDGHALEERRYVCEKCPREFLVVVKSV